MNFFNFEQIDNCDLTTHQQKLVQYYTNAAQHFYVINASSCMAALPDILYRYPHAVLWTNEHQSVCLTKDSFPVSDSEQTRFYFSMDTFRFYLTGLYVHSVVRLAACLWTIDNPYPNQTIHFDGERTSHCFDWNLFTAEQVTSLLSKRKVLFHHIKLSREFSIHLASQSFPVDLSLYESSFVDDGNSFLGTLENKKSTFGSLTFFGCDELKPFFWKRLFQLSAIDLLRIISFDRKPLDSITSLPFTSKANKVELEIVQPNDEWKTVLQSTTIVSKSFTLKMTKESFDIVSSFLRATTHLTALGLILKELPTVQTWCDLIAAVDCNQNLEELELGVIDRSWLSEWEGLMSVMRKHHGLSRLILHGSLGQLVPEMSDALQAMLDNNRKITDITFFDSNDDASGWNRPPFNCFYQGSKFVQNNNECRLGLLADSVAFNRFYQGSKTLQRESEKERMPLLVVAIERAHHDTRKTALLLSDHFDALCTLLMTQNAKRR